SNSSTFYCGTDGGIFRHTGNILSPDWEELTANYTNSLIYSVAIDHATPNDQTIIAGLQDNGSWGTNRPGLQNWEGDYSGGDGAYTAIADHRDYYYTSYQFANIQQSLLDEAMIVQSASKVNIPATDNFIFLVPFRLYPNNS